MSDITCIYRSETFEGVELKQNPLTLLMCMHDLPCKNLLQPFIDAPGPRQKYEIWYLNFVDGHLNISDG